VTNGPEFELTPAAILAEAAEVLSSAGYHLERDSEALLQLPSERSFLAEDKYGVVAVVVFDTWRELAGQWQLAQASIVDTVSREYTRIDRKAWDGYLVLLTSALPDEGDETAQEIRYDTRRVRKIVAAGNDIRSLSDVERVLLPLLPLSPETVEVGDSQSLLAELPDRLEDAGVSRDIAQVAVDAFTNHKPIVQEIHRYLSVQ
jgi:hypothetical protein